MVFNGGHSKYYLIDGFHSSANALQESPALLDTLQRNKAPAVEPQYNDGPMDWQNIFALTKLCCIAGGSFTHFTIAGKKHIARSVPSTLYGGLCIYSTKHILT